MNWFRVTLQGLPAGREQVWGLLYKFDCVGLEETDGGSCHAYFDAGVDTGQLLQSLRLNPLVGSAEGSWIESENWHARWMESYGSFRVGPFFIRPSWKSDLPPPQAIEIVMDPQSAFGTGTHATTQLCLKSLADLIPGARALTDVGCGSGILSIAARKLSPDIKLLALDLDWEACRVCRDNARINGVHVDILCGPFDATRHNFDLIVANLQLDELVRLRDNFHERTSAGAQLLMSGVLTEQAAELRSAYESGFSLLQQYEQENWTACLYQRQ